MRLPMDSVVPLVAWQGDGLLVGTENGAVSRWDLQGHLTQRLSLLDTNLYHVSLSPDGDILAAHGATAGCHHGVEPAGKARSPIQRYRIRRPTSSSPPTARASRWQPVTSSR